MVFTTHSIDYYMLLFCVHVDIWMETSRVLLAASWRYFETFENGPVFCLFMMNHDAGGVNMSCLMSVMSRRHAVTMLEMPMGWKLSHTFMVPSPVNAYQDFICIPDEQLDVQKPQTTRPCFLTQKWAPLATLCKLCPAALVLVLLAFVAWMQPHCSCNRKVMYGGLMLQRWTVSEYDHSLGAIASISSFPTSLV